MTLTLIRNDIALVSADAIVTSTDPLFSGSGGADRRIHEAAGPKLDAACRKLNACPTGSVRVTKAYDLHAKYVIHAVSPVWVDGTSGERERLAETYRAALSAAVEKRCASVAFPLLSTGSFGFPKAQAFRVAMDTVRGFLMESDAELHVILVVFDAESTAVGLAYDDGLHQYIDDHFAAEAAYANSCQTVRRSNFPRPMRKARKSGKAASEKDEICCDTLSAAEMQIPEPEMEISAPPMQAAPMPQMAAQRGDLSDALSKLDESFTQMLLRKIDESGMTDAECYKKANVDRKLFSKIRKDPSYRPSKPTALAFAVALQLPLDETKSLLQKAGYALSRSYRFDVILEYYISRGIYDVFTINESLFAYDQSLLGG